MKSLCSLAAVLLACLFPASGSDSRRSPAVTLDGYHPFRSVKSEDWPRRQADIRLRTQVAAGLWPMPEKSPLQPVVHGTVDGGDYVVDRVIFESLPGHFVTGSLFRPAGASLSWGGRNGKRPVVLCPHGHWKNGRFYDAGEAQALQEIATGAERFVAAGRNPIQARCVQLARMGCVVFLYDMLGYADSVQFPEHRNGPRPQMSSLTPGEWGFVSPAATARLQTNFGLQTWNSVRSLDFLLSLPEADPGRVLVTGASGGGTQTMILAAIDPRVTAAFPCVMVSTSMQGGCTCENSHYLRIGQGNVDIAAAFAPKPLGLTAADDWTVELKTKGHPDLLALYQTLKSPLNYEAHFNIQFKHNYNHVSRSQMYQFANRHLGLGLPSPVLERDFRRLEQEDLTVWNGSHPAPSGDQAGEVHEKAVCRWWTEDSDRQIRARLAGDGASFRQTREVLREAFRVLIGRDLPGAEDLIFEPGGESLAGTSRVSRGVLRNRRDGEEVSVLLLTPAQPNGNVVLWLTPPGMAPNLAEPFVARLVATGCSLMLPELYSPSNPQDPQGAGLAASGKPGDEWKLSPVYYYGYNPSLFAKRVHDILTCLAFLKTASDWKSHPIGLAGLQGTGHFALAALAVAGEAVNRALVEADGFRFSSLNHSWHPDFLPGAVKYGDVVGMASLRLPLRMWIGGADAELKRQVESFYQSAGCPEALNLGDLQPEAVAKYFGPGASGSVSPGLPARPDQ